MAPPELAGEIVQFAKRVVAQYPELPSTSLILVDVFVKVTIWLGHSVVVGLYVKSGIG